MFWFLDHYRRPGSSQHPGFALSVHYHISGKLDVMAMTTAVDQLVQRHEALRIKVQLAASEGTQNSARADPQSFPSPVSLPIIRCGLAAARE